MKPTLVLMAKAPRLGRVKTRLAAALGDAEAVRIYRLLVERQLRAVPPDWSLEVHFDPPEAEEEMRAWLEPQASGRELVFNAQCEGDLGERLGHAMLNAFARRAESLIFVGGDCPGLSAAVLTEAAEALAVSDVVIGPAMDGGYVFIGLRSHRYDLFHGIYWGTAEVFAQTLARVAKGGLTCVTLAGLADVDNLSDWKRAKQEFGLV